MSAAQENTAPKRGIMAVRADARREITEVLAGLQRDWSDFKASSEAKNEKLRAQVNDLQAELDQAAVKAAAFGINGGKSNFSDDLGSRNERAAIGDFVRSGSEVGVKALSVGTPSDGGYTVLTQFANAIRVKVREVSPFANLVRRVVLNTGDKWAEPYDIGEIGAAWVTETAARPGLTESTFGLLEIPLAEIYTSQIVTQKLLDTSDYDIGNFVSGRIVNKFAVSEGAAFISGDGVNKPQGLLSYTTSTDDDSTRTHGEIQYIPSGADGAFTATSPYDTLVDLVHSLRAPYRPRAAFLMNRKTAGTVRKFKDANGQPLWQQSMAAGQPETILGFPVYIDEQMPDIASDSLSIAFGDYEQAYTIVEQPGVKMLRDPYSSKPNVIFYAYRRVGGAAADYDAVKFMKFAAS
ncbi:phage major capsid protein [Mangrovicoccus sp. HB161399]|uniref:phage major capsid protein n=1 Tax=Mangrovicoccus sp. HB161399 TaxID=2720392 RepID=UPI0015578B8B|nr:phage major capsid protein [Mangrovicoccus sp. HB161399]